jgi:hypothetical protein
MFGFKMPVNVDGLEAKADAIGNVLNDFNVFGNVDGKWLESEMRGFKNMVISHTLGDRSRNYLELTYHYSCVRLIINTRIVENKAVFTDITAYDHPWKNENTDYEGLNKAIQEVLNQK